MNKVLGILAPVDGGKTTLSEQILYKTGSIRATGRVDHGDSFLDTNDLERKRGITIFSSEARFSLTTGSCKVDITLLDTPGHVDFAAEMERALSVLDFCILVINAGDGVTGYVKTLWKLLIKHDLPTWIFINKTDLEGVDKENVISDLVDHLSERCIPLEEAHMEDIALLDEALMDEFLSEGTLRSETLSRLINERGLFPVYSGSALHGEGVDELLEGFSKYAFSSDISEAADPHITELHSCIPSVGCTHITDTHITELHPSGTLVRIYKISRDTKGTRLTHLKVIKGTLHVKDLFGEEKIDQIRLYNGSGYELAREATKGQICAVTGLSKAQVEYDSTLLPVLTYELIPEGPVDYMDLMRRLAQLSEESPEISFIFMSPGDSGEGKYSIQVRVMGEIQLEVLKEIILQRFDQNVSWGPGKVLYKETISSPIKGIGHYEPLKHYAEAHIMITPLPEGRGIEIESKLSEDILDRNYQRLIMTHLGEKKHLGVLTGSELTDVKYTLIAGKAHLKHTEGGDFREATYRAVRHALRSSNVSVLLEPVYAFELTVPINMLGRAMKDMEIRGGHCDSPILEAETATITGRVPVALTTDYHREVMTYTSGRGRFTCVSDGYSICHNTAEVIESIGYDPDADTDNPCGSVFCSHGAGYYVPWDEVEGMAHIE